MTTFTTGDTAPDLTATANANLTGAAVALHLRLPDATVLTRTATIVDAAAGTLSYSWATGELSQAGSWLMEAQVTFAGGKIQTFGPAAFTVQSQIA